MPATPQQQAAIDCHDGASIVVACPGSGKSTTLAGRCKALPSRETKQVLMFNAQAREDFSKKIGDVSSCDVKTFHQFCMHEVWGNPKPYGFQRRPVLLKDLGFLAQVKKANGLFGIDGEPNSWADAGWDRDYAQWTESLYTHELIALGQSTAERAKQQQEYVRINPNDEHAKAQLAITVERLQTLRGMGNYRYWLEETNQFTFNSVIRTVAEHSNELRKAADHVMVDEFQDVDRFQFDIVNSIAGHEKTKSFMCVGDPNQMIYEWRGALSDSFQQIENNHNARRLPLTVNFRSHDEILQHAEMICSVGMTGVRGTGGPKCVERMPIDEEERKAGDPPKGRAFQYLMQSRTDYHNHAILCQFNRQCAQWQIFLAKKGIPVHLIGKGDYWNSEHIKLAKDKWLERYSVQDFFDCKQWRVIEKRKQYQDEEGKEQLKELQEECKFILELTSEDMSLLGSNFDNPRDGVRISTMHKTKGAEFPVVLVYGITEFLYKNVFLHYVACTRAKDRMVLA